MSNILLGQTTRRVVLLLALTGCLFYLKSPQRSYATGLTKCETACIDAWEVCVGRCDDDLDCVHAVCDPVVNACLAQCNK
jgi:hypothetical protein